ncbi:signal recognition particle-docking protein FtsY, partial [bacterium]
MFGKGKSESENGGGGGFFGRLKERLSRSASRLTDELRGLFRGRKIDAELLEELETRLI